ncbi:hypothetical protein F5144DRAFT_569758 [Chaetomium tenue]|uniref:Uncharacterized protein n=1 Tax=Chaetomium tenue TaxID=1854479 RepID=A0ACB7PFT3_9PEZI|nr:hypothetical protein F5144DRAFT_569758 [Chaetomium globosum]
MGRALRIARSAQILTARCLPVVPPAVASARLWQQHRGVQTSPANHASAASSATNHKDVNANNPLSHHKKDWNRAQSNGGIVEWSEDKLRFRFQDQEWDELAVSHLWLRDSCPCHSCVDPDSGQKNFSTTDLHDNPTIENAKLHHDGSLEIIWANDGPSGGGQHQSLYPAAELRAWQMNSAWQRGSMGHSDPRRILWDRAGYEALLSAGRCRVSYEDWMNASSDNTNAAFQSALTDLRRTGLIFITNVPADDEGAVERIARRIGPVQETFYGRTWDVRSKPRAENVAYTDKFLCLHQDLMYHDPVPGLQLLHCLANTCEGGESLFSHAVRAAYELRLTQRRRYEDLAGLGVYFGYEKGGQHCFKMQKTIVTAPNGLPRETRWAPPFQATFPLASGEVSSKSMADWKKAAAAFQAIAEAEENMLEVKLKEGECVIFDNRQILHGRRQFAAGQGSRWLKGTYVSRQDYAAAAERQSKHVLPARGAPYSMWEEEAAMEGVLLAQERKVDGGTSAV